MAKRSIPIPDGSHTQPAVLRFVRVSAHSHSLRFFVALLLVISFILPVENNLSATTGLDMGGTHYDAGEDRFEMCLFYTHPAVPDAGSKTSGSGDGAEISFDSCDADMDAEGLPICHTHRVFLASAPVFSEDESPCLQTPVFSLYKPPRA